MNTQIQPKQLAESHWLGYNELKSQNDNISNPSALLEQLDKIFQWGRDRGITIDNGGTPEAQLVKLKEEFDELEQGIHTGETATVADSIGDMIVVLMQIARLTGIPFEQCVDVAWKNIKDRKGRMFCGVFVKRADLTTVGAAGMRARLGAAKDAQEVREIIMRAKELKD